MRHATVFSAPDRYAGWPANHGAWQRADELLVGFMRGAFDDSRSTHHIRPPFEKVLARSLDGGETWTVEVPNVDFKGDGLLSPPPQFDLADPSTIIRCCGSYDHGGEDCFINGSFYLSRDFGRSWDGAFVFDGMVSDEDVFSTTRTCVLPARRLVFLSYAREWFHDWTVCARHDGRRFVELGVVCRDAHRAVMPAVAELDGAICCALRRRMVRTCWIDLFASRDGGRTWTHVSEVDETGDHNGNPPALVVGGDGRTLICAYADRTARAMLFRLSGDYGLSWSKPYAIRRGDCVDVGYPRLFTRPDGNVVCVYYWSDAGEAQRIESSILF